MFDASYVVIANSTGAASQRHHARHAESAGRRDREGRERRAQRHPQERAAPAQGCSTRGRRASPKTERLQALEDQLKRYVAAGLTTVGDRADTAGADRAVPEAEGGRAGCPIRAVLTWRPDASRPDGGAERGHPLRAASPPTTATTGCEFGTFKLTLDGGMTIGTAFQRYPYGPFGKQLYGKTNPDDRGQLFIAPEKLRTVMRRGARPRLAADDARPGRRRGGRLARRAGGARSARSRSRPRART